MAEWKKIIVSGSAASLASVNADGTISASVFSASMGFHGDGSGLSNITAESANTASYVSGSNVDGEVASASLAITASYVAGANVDGTVENANTASYVLTSSIVDFDSHVSASAAASGFGGDGISSMDTSSFYISSSVSGSTLTFRQGDGSDDTLTVDNVTTALTASYVDLNIVLDGSGIASSSAQITDLIDGQDVTLGTVTATELVTEIVSSSIVLTTGSNIFGDELTDVHEFTGSVSVTGSVTATSFTGDGSGLTNVTADTADTASYVEWENIDDIPDGLISGAAQIAPDVTYNNIPLWSGSFQDSLISQINGGGRISSGSGTYINNAAVGGLTGSGLFNLNISDGQDLTADVSYLNAVNFSIPINNQAHARSLVGSVNEDDINFTDQTDVSLLTEPITWRFEKVGGGATFEAEFYFVIHQPNAGGGNKLTFRFGWQPGTPSDLPAGFTNNVANADSVLEATGTWDDDAPYVLNSFLPDGTSSSTVDIDGTLDISGSLIVSESVTFSNITASAGSTFTLQVDDSGSVSAVEAVSSDTGSLLTTASIASGSDITFTKGDGTTFDIIVDSVDSASVADLATTASHVAAADVFGNVATASLALRAEVATAATASYIDDNVVVGTAGEITVASSSGQLTIGLPDDVTIAGNLTVQGTQTNLNVANLDVEDKFIILNSGSAAGDAGIVFNQGGNVGPALGYDQSATRLGYQLNLSGSATAIAPDAFVTLTSEGGSGEDTPADASLDSAVEQKGSIFIGDNGDIYIYS